REVELVAPGIEDQARRRRAVDLLNRHDVGTDQLGVARQPLVVRLAARYLPFARRAVEPGDVPGREGDAARERGGHGSACRPRATAAPSRSTRASCRRAW